MSDAAQSRVDSEDADTELEAKIRLLFDRSVSNVQSHFSKMQQTYLIPSYGNARAFSKDYPVLSLYIGISFALGLVPIFVFLSASIVVLSTSVFLALSLSLIFSTAVIGAFGVLLFCTFFWISLLSVASTLLVIGTYLLIRLVSHVRTQQTLQAGIRQWFSEIQAFMRSRLPDQRHWESKDVSRVQLNGADKPESGMPIRKSPDSQKEEDMIRVVKEEVSGDDPLLAAS